MKAEIVNCFVNAFETTLKEKGGFDLSCKYKKAENYIEVSERVGIIIDLFGGSTIHGKVIITMDKEIAQKIIGFLMEGSTVEEIDQDAASALGEYANWITASAATQVQEYGESISNFKVDIEANLDKSGEKISCDGDMPFLSLGYLVDNDDIELSMAIA
ncbi:chemotaxis protein CheX [Clostridium cellulovorans]|uniref:Chemotaxis phosphatase CheX-like domain-containing protein n=1 Tax=Clostridium cellulovorans (strain ATCC 35296 / DSM 3052 / OCM 3 / 743B) TaxID=573061 RepID=D9SQS9_CLOC7|nr:chemotaxis protein CheX [Clostridium cellulovorans]ADL52285.1 hypothetical protein Clocel_2573 [Clostridium cellulovorans 743B]